MPLYSLDSVYFGYMDLHWDEAPKELFEDYSTFMTRIYTTCTFAARKIGIHKIINQDAW